MNTANKNDLKGILSLAQSTQIRLNVYVYDFTLLSYTYI